MGRIHVLRDDVVHDVSVDVGQSKVSTLKSIRQTLMIDAEKV